MKCRLPLRLLVTLATGLAATGLAGCGNTTLNTSSSTEAPALPPNNVATVKPKRAYDSARAIGRLIAADRSGPGCRFVQTIARGKAVHPVDQGYTGSQMGLSDEAFDMNNRLIESGSCFTRRNSVIGITRFSGRNLSVREYRTRLKETILPEACTAFGDAKAPIIDVVWRDRGTIWSVEPGSRDQESIVAFTPSEARRVTRRLASRVGGTIVSHSC